MRRGATSSLIVFMLVALVVGVFAPASSAQPGSPADAPVVLRAKDVVARAHTDGAGTSVDVSFTVANRTARRQAGEKVLLFLYAGGETRSLGTGRTPSVPGGASRDIEVSAKVGPRVLAGRYAVMVCLIRKEPGRCASTSGKPVRVRRPVLVADQASVSWDPVGVGRSTAARTVRLTNTGRSWTGRLRIGVDAPVFSRSSDCSGLRYGLAPGAGCTVTVAATPAVAGPVAGTLQVGGRSVEPLSIGLRASGLAPAALTVSPSTRQFEQTPRGVAGDPEMFTVTNSGGQPSGVPAVDLGGSTDFAITANGCTAALPAGGSCQVEAGFRPGSVGDREATLRVAAIPGGTTTARLTGTGIAPAQLILSGTQGAFQPQIVGGGGGFDSMVTFSFQNTGAVVTGRPEVTIAPTDDFKVIRDDCEVELAPGGVCAVEVQFLPSAGGRRTATLQVAATPGGTASVELAGTGLAVASLSITPQSFDFPETVANNVSAPQRFTVTNDGDLETDAAVTVALEDGAASHFDVVDTTCTAVLVGHATCTVDVVFSPQASGPKSDRLLVTAAADEATSARLTGVAARPAILTISPPSATFNDTLIGEHASIPFGISNTGDRPTDGPVSLSTTNADFAVVGFCGVLAPRASCTVNVVFSPSGSGPVSGRLDVATNAGLAVSADLNGVGVKPATLELDQTEVNFEAQRLYLDGEAKRTLKLTNTGDESSGVLDFSLTNTTDFTYWAEDNTCPAVLAAHSSCTFRVTFFPAFGGLRTSRLNVTGEPGGVASATLQGTALLTPGSSFVVKPASATLRFADTAVNHESATTTLTVVSYGDQPIPLVVDITGDWVISSRDCPDPVPAGTTCTLGIAFKPTSPGPQTGRIDLFQIPSSGGYVSNQLRGTGL
ncbi:MAG TPA: choice-of-anchor D domain-containing protein [Nocardioides sp.]|nr:choice-of-anchor D domain-containing protein [Nocardioides sp.]